MMFSIIVAIAVFVVIVIARRMLNGEDAVTTNMMYVKSVVVGMVVGAIDYLSTIISGETGTLWLCWAFLGVMLCLYAWLAYWWQAEGGTWTEMIPFAILAGLFYWPAKAAAMTTTAFCDGNVTAGIIAILPTLALVAVLGYFVASHLWFLHNEVDQVHRGDKPEIKEQKQRKASLRKGLAIASAFVTAFALALVVYAGVDWSAEQPDSEASAATTETQEIGEDEKFVQNWTDNGNNRLDDQFATKLAEKAKASGGEITADIVEEAVLENCGHDARLLAIWSNAFGLWDDPNDYEALLTADKKYLSEEGIQLYYRLEGYLKAVKVVREPAPADGTNTGYDNGYVVATSAGVSGDRTGTKFTSPDKDVEPFWLMDRCSNLVYRKAPKVPTGHTDNPGRGDNPSGPKYNKDPNKAPKTDTEPNDDPGPGPDTNNPKNPNKSSKDTDDSSTSGSYDDYKKGVEEKKEVNQNQKKGGDSNTSSTPKPSPKANVDNNADKGTGNGSIDTPTPQKPKAKEADSGKEINNKAGEAWEGPAD